jgi:hypothetical protein
MSQSRLYIQTVLTSLFLREQNHTSRPRAENNGTRFAVVRIDFAHSADSKLFDYFVMPKTFAYAENKCRGFDISCQRLQAKNRFRRECRA